MLKIIKFIKAKDKKNIILALFIIGYLVLTLPVLFQTNHVIKNLEPYPDGLLYSLGAKNLVLGRGLKLSTNWGEVPFWVPPLYPWYLSIFYFFSSHILSFYIGNLALGLGTIYLIYSIIKKTTNSWKALILGLSVYFSHLVIFWLPSLPMTENLSIFLFTLVIMGLTEEKINTKIIFVLFSSLALVFLRFSILPIILAVFLLVILQLKEKIKPYLRKILLFILSLLIIFIIAIRIGFISEQISIFTSAIFDPVFFNLKYFFPNLSTYFNSLFINSGFFLWLQNGVTSWPILGFFLYSLFCLFKNKETSKFNILGWLFLSLFPLQLIFYTADARYLIYSIVLFAISAAWLIEKKSNRKIILLLTISILINLVYQKDLLKKIVSDNLLGKSAAWQYEAIRYFNSQLQDRDLLITALPPFLVDEYQTTSYRPLPLSYSQEFLQKKQYIWGDDINYNDLYTTYEQWLAEGKTIYISNAYITHQQSVIDDYEKYKEMFEFELVEKGCLEACNIYKLGIKN